MKILAFVDTHGNKEAFKKIEEKAKKADILLCAGDLTIFESDLDKWLKRLNRIKKKCFIVPGNHETPSELKRLCKDLKHVDYIHKRIFLAGNHMVMGFSGNGFIQDEPSFANTAKRFEKAIAMHKDAKKILLMHAPPYKTKLDELYGEHVGNKTLANFIRKNQPNLAICGHIHENEYKKDKIKKTIVINPGPEGRILRIK